MKDRSVDLETIYNELIDLRLKKAYSQNSLIKYLIEKYGYSKSRSYEIIRESRIRMGEMYTKLSDNSLADSILYMQNQLEAAIGRGENKLALEIQKEINKVSQLYIEKNEIKITGSLNLKDLLDFDKGDE